MKAAARPCCDFDAFHDAFMQAWARYVDWPRVPDQMQRKAQAHWRSGMMGHESVLTLRNRMRKIPRASRALVSGDQDE